MDEKGRDADMKKAELTLEEYREALVELSRHIRSAVNKFEFRGTSMEYLPANLVFGTLCSDIVVVGLMLKLPEEFFDRVMESQKTTYKRMCRNGMD